MSISFSDIYNVGTRKVLPALVMLFISYYLYSNLYKDTLFENNLNSSEQELEKGSVREVLNTRGRLTTAGWGTNPSLINLTPEYIRPTTSILKEINAYRYKKWERYVFTSRDITFSLMVYDFAYCGGYSLFYSDIRDEDTSIKRFSSILFGEGTSVSNNCHEKCYSITVSAKEGNALKKADFYKFNVNSHKVRVNFQEKGLNMELELTASTIKNDNLSSIVNIAGISDDSSLFYVNTNTNNMNVKGKIVINGKTLQPSLFKVSYNSVVGVFPLRAKWYWITANGVAKDNSSTSIGLNFGYGLVNPLSSVSTEDAFNVNGVTYKLKSTKIDLSENFNNSYFDDSESSIIKIYTQNNESNENECNIRFKPQKKLIDSYNIYYVIYLKTNISHGIFSGYCKSKNGKRYEFDSLYGSVELKDNMF